MIFANYPDFRNKVLTLLDGDDVSTSDISASTLDLIISTGEQRLYRELRSSTQDTAFALTTTNNTIPLPADFLEMHGAPYVGTFVAAVYAPWEVLTNMIQIQAGISTYLGNDNHPVYYSFQNDAMFFYPVQQDEADVQGQYYKRFPDISTGLNALFTRHPDLFLYAALAEAALFVGEQTRQPQWESKYATLVGGANEQERKRYTRGGKLSARIG